MDVNSGSDDSDVIEMYYDDGDPAGIDEDEDDDQDAVEDQSVACFRHHKDSIYAVAFSPTDSAIVLSGSGDDRAYLLNAATGEVLNELSGHTDSVVSVGFSYDGVYAATGGMDGLVMVWEVASGRQILSLEGCQEVEWVAWHSKGLVLLAGNCDGSVWMWHVPSGNVMHVLTGHSDSVRAGTFTHDGKSIVTVSADKTLIVWDPKNGTPKLKMGSGTARWHENGLTCVAVHHDNVIVASADDSGLVLLSNIKTGKVVASFSHDDSCEALSFAPSLPYLVSGALDGSLHVWDIDSLRLRHKCQHKEGVVALHCHPTQPSFISASVDNTVAAWDLRTGTSIRQWTGHTDSVLCLALARDGSLIASGSDDSTVRIFQYSDAE